MKILLNLFIISIITRITKTQKQCFTRKTTTADSGPLKLSLTDPIKDFESGSYSIVNSIVNKNPQSSQRYTCFNITFMYINGKNNYQVVASIQNIDSYQDKEGLDFSVRFSPNPTVIQGLFIMSKTANWTSVNIHYVLSAREDFRVGTFVPETAQFLPCGKQSQDLIINHKLVKPWTASKKLIFGLPFLSGIRTMDNEINVNFSKSTFDPQTNLLQIPMSFNQVQYPVEYILISYLIVTMDSQFQITNIYDLDYIPGDINVFVGMTGVKTAPVQVKTTGVLKSSAVNVTNKNKFRQFFEVQGLVIQSTSNLDILFSSGNYSTNQTLQCISSDKCLAYDGYMKYYQNEDGFIFRSECILCEKYASYNNITGQCVCRNLYVRLNSSCVAKQNACEKITQIYNEKLEKCQCSNGYIEKNAVCVLNTSCPQGYTSFKGNCYKVTKVINLTSSTQTSTQSVSISVTTCQSPMTWNQITKTCQCPANNYLDGTTKKCVSCKQNEVLNSKSKTCQCMNGSFRINELCQFCSSHGFFNGSGCQCLPGYLGNGKICRQDPKFSNQTLGLSNSLKLNSKDNSIANSSVLVKNLSKQTDQKPMILGEIQLN